MDGLLCVLVKKSPLSDIYSHLNQTEKTPKLRTMHNYFSLGLGWQIFWLTWQLVFKDIPRNFQQRGGHIVTAPGGEIKKWGSW